MSTNVSTTNGNKWAPRKSEKWIAPSGQEVWTRAPGPEFTLRLGRTPRAFTTTESVPQRREGQTEEEYGREVLDQISDEGLVTFARELLVAMVETPKLVHEPGPGQLGPDDTGTDFWPLYQYGMSKYFNRSVSVPAGDGEVEANDLTTFPSESGISGDSVDGVSVPVAITEPETADSGLVNGAGA